MMLDRCDDTVHRAVQSCSRAERLAHDKNSGRRRIEAGGPARKQAVRYDVEVDQSIVETDSSVSMRSITIAIREVQSKSTHIDAGTASWTVAPDVVRSDSSTHFLVNYDAYCPGELMCKTQFELLFTMPDNYGEAGRTQPRAGEHGDLLVSTSTVNGTCPRLSPVMPSSAWTSISRRWER